MGGDHCETLNSANWLKAGQDRCSLGTALRCGRGALLYYELSQSVKRRQVRGSLNTKMRLGNGEGVTVKR